MIQIFKNTKYDFLRYSKVAIGLILSFILVSVVMLVVSGGFNLSVDFAGGTAMQVLFEKPLQPDELPKIRESISALGFGTPEIKTSRRSGMSTARSGDTQAATVAASVTDNVAAAPEIVINDAAEETADATPETAVTDGAADTDSGDAGESVVAQSADAPESVATSTPSVATDATGDNAVQITVRSQSEGANVRGKVEGALAEAMPNNAFVVLSADEVGPKIGRELTRDAIIVSLLALLAILSYVGLRFKLSYAVASVIPLGVNVLIILGVFAAFRLELTLPFLAAVLTVIGYALNDTIVVFDRVRENLKNGLRGRQFNDVINASINQTLSRTIVTSVTTLLTVGMLYLLGSDSIKDFALALGVGIIVGTLSTMFIASFILTQWHKKWAIAK